MRIVVGVDGSEGSAAALRWALDEASARSCPVTALLAYGRYGRPQTVQDRAGAGGEGELQQAATEVLRETVAAVAGSAFDSDGSALELVTAAAEPVDALCGALSDGDLLVVGRRGTRTVPRMFIGSVSAACARAARNSVVVVRAPLVVDDTRPVLVGVGGSPSSVAALEWAAGHARVRGLPLHVVRAWVPPAPAGAVTSDSGTTAETREQADKELREIVDRCTGSSNVCTTTKLTDGYAAPILLRGADEVSLLVVGAQGSPGAGHALSSTSKSCLVYAESTVAIIRNDPSGG